MNIHETEQFIEAVKRYPCVWNVYIRTYKCREMKDAAWREIIKQTSVVDIETAKEKWKKLKDAFREALNKRKKDLRRGKKVKPGRPYRFHHVMEFLLPILESPGEGTGEELSNPEEEAGELNDLSAYSTHDPMAFVQVEPVSCSPAPAPRGYKRPSSEPLDLLADDSRREERQASHGSELDVMDRFFLSMSETTKKVSVPLQLQVKRKVFLAVLEAEEQEYQLQHPHSSHPHGEEDVKPVLT